jgi:hypothetical protein
LRITQEIEQSTNDDNHETANLSRLCLLALSLFDRYPFRGKIGSPSIGVGGFWREDALWKARKPFLHPPPHGSRPSHRADDDGVEGMT